MNSVIAELAPEIVNPSKAKQKAIGVDEAMLLFRVGFYRIITIFPLDRGTWNIKQFDSESGELVLLSDETAAVAEAEVPSWVLAATITCIEDQLAAYAIHGVPTPEHGKSSEQIRRQLAVLKQRLITAGGKVSVGVVSVGVASTNDDFDEYLGQASGHRW